MEVIMQIQKDSVSNAGSFVAVLSTSRIDRQGDVVRPEAFASFKHQKRPLLIGHKRDELPVGVATVSEIESDRVLVRGQLMMTSARAQEAHALMREGVVSLSWAGRVAKGGARLNDGVREIMRLDSLDEITLTAVPANPDARIISTKSFGERVAEAISGAREEMGAIVQGSLFELAKAVGDPILGTSFGTPKAHIDPKLSTRTGSWVSRLRRIEVPTGMILSGKIQGAEGDVAEQVEGAAKSPITILFDDDEVMLPANAGVIHCSRNLLNDSPNFSALVDSFLASRIIRAVEVRAASILSALDATPEADGFDAMGELADDGYAPTVVLMPPLSVYAYSKTLSNKDAAPRMAGLPVLPCAGLTVGLVVAEAALSFVEREGIAVEVGMIDADFTRNMRTVRGEGRAIVDYNDARSVRSFDLPA